MSSTGTNTHVAKPTLPNLSSLSLLNGVPTEAKRKHDEGTSATDPLEPEKQKNESFDEQLMKRAALEAVSEREREALRVLLSGFPSGFDKKRVQLQFTPPIEFVHHTFLKGSDRYGPQEKDNEVIEWYLWFKGHSAVDYHVWSQIRQNFETYVRAFWFLPNNTGDDSLFSSTWNKRLLIIDEKYTIGQLDARRFHFCLYLPPDRAGEFMEWINGQLSGLDPSGASAFWKRFLGLSQALTTNAGSRPVNRGAFTATTTQEGGRSVWAPLPAHSKGLSITESEGEAWQTLALEKIPTPPNYNDAVLRTEQFNNYAGPNNPKDQNPMDFAVAWSFYLKGSLQNQYGQNIHEQFRNNVREWFSDFMQTWGNSQLLPVESIKKRLVISHHEFETMNRLGAPRLRRLGQLLAKRDVLAPVVKCEFLFYLPKCHALAFKIMLDGMVDLKGLDEAMQDLLGISGAKKMYTYRDKEARSRIFSVSDAATYVDTFLQRAKTDPPTDLPKTYAEWPDYTILNSGGGGEGGGGEGGGGEGGVPNDNNNNTSNRKRPRAPPPIID